MLAAAGLSELTSCRPPVGEGEKRLAAVGTQRLFSREHGLLAGRWVPDPPPVFLSLRPRGLRPPHGRGWGTVGTSAGRH